MEEKEQCKGDRMIQERDFPPEKMTESEKTKGTMESKEVCEVAKVVIPDKACSRRRRCSTEGEERGAMVVSVCDPKPWLCSLVDSCLSKL